MKLIGAACFNPIDNVAIVAQVAEIRHEAGRGPSSKISQSFSRLSVRSVCSFSKNFPNSRFRDGDGMRFRFHLVLGFCCDVAGYCKLSAGAAKLDAINVQDSTRSIFNIRCHNPFPVAIGTDMAGNGDVARHFKKKCLSKSAMTAKLDRKLKSAFLIFNFYFQYSFPGRSGTGTIPLRRCQ